MNRVRSRGGPHTEATLRRSHNQYQYRYVWVGSKRVLETRTVPITEPTPSVVFDSTETISDVVGARDLYNPVTHLRSIEDHDLVIYAQEKVSPFPGGGETTGTWYTYRDSYGALTIPWSARNHALSPLQGWSAANAVDWASLVSQVGDQLDGHMTTNSNILVEAAQLLSTVSMLKNPFNVRALKKLSKSDLTLSKLAKTSANSWLEYQYGWRNLELSMRDFSCVVNKIRAHRNFLRSTDDLYTPCSAASETKSYVGRGTVIGSTQVASACTVSLMREYTHVKARFSLNVRRHNALQRWSRLDHAIQATGANDILGALWDLVPFSFVLDWFVQWNDMVLHSPAYLSQVYDLRRIGYSVKTEYFGNYRVSTTGTTYKGISIYSSDQVRRISSSYARYPGFPSGNGNVGVFGKLNKTQLASGLALIVQRL